MAADKKKKEVSLITIFLSFFVLVAALVGLLFLQEKLNPLSNPDTTSPNSEQPSDNTNVVEGFSTDSELPQLSSSDWELILVNQDHSKEEMNPDLTEVSGVQVDSRIAEDSANFLAAAQAINSGVRLLAGYRSFDEQKEGYETRVSQEMEARGIDQLAAEEVVKTYWQPAGTSEHMTGLAIDLSTMASQNQMDQETASQLAAIAPDYGFVLRYKAEYSEQTGMSYEDWHFRYVGKESARYMTDHNLSLEAYVSLLDSR